MTFKQTSFMIAFALFTGISVPGAQAKDDARPLPDAPSPNKQQAQQVQVASNAPLAPGLASAIPQPEQGKQTKRILYVVPNFRAVSADEQLPPQSVKEKFKTATEDSFDYSSFIFVGGQAGVGQASKSYPEFGQGAKGYGRYYWHTLADSVNENTFVEFIVPAVMHQDTRYYTLGHGSLAKRAGYAFSRVFLTRDDDGHQTFNYSEVVGAGMFAAASNLYYPAQERTEVKSYQRWVTNIIIDGCVFTLKEIWPDINQATFRQSE